MMSIKLFYDNKRVSKMLSYQNYFITKNTPVLISDTLFELENATIFKFIRFYSKLKLEIYI